MRFENFIPEYDLICGKPFPGEKSRGPAFFECLFSNQEGEWGFGKALSVAKGECICICTYEIRSLFSHLYFSWRFGTLSSALQGHTTYKEELLHFFLNVSPIIGRIWEPKIWTGVFIGGWKADTRCNKISHTASTNIQGKRREVPHLSQNFCCVRVCQRCVDLRYLTFLFKLFWNFFTSSTFFYFFFTFGKLFYHRRRVEIADSRTCTV